MINKFWEPEEYPCIEGQRGSNLHPRTYVIYISPQPVVKMADKPISSQEGACPEGHEEETNSHTLKSGSVKSEDHTISTLEQELDCLKQIVTQQNQVLQHLGAQLRTPPHQVTTTKPRDIPVLELHQLQGRNATTHLQKFFGAS